MLTAGTEVKVCSEVVWWHLMYCVGCSLPGNEHCNCNSLFRKITFLLGKNEVEVWEITNSSTLFSTRLQTVDKYIYSVPFYLFRFRSQLRHESAQRRCRWLHRLRWEQICCMRLASEKCIWHVCGLETCFITNSGEPRTQLHYLTQSIASLKNSLYILLCILFS